MSHENSNSPLKRARDDDAAAAAAQEEAPATKAARSVNHNSPSSPSSPAPAPRHMRVFVDQRGDRKSMYSFYVLQTVDGEKASRIHEIVSDAYENNEVANYDFYTKASKKAKEIRDIDVGTLFQLAGIGKFKANKWYDDDHLDEAALRARVARNEAVAAFVRCLDELRPLIDPTEWSIDDEKLVLMIM